MQREDIKSSLDELKQYTETYLREKGITTKLFRCLSPDHEDKHPSMTYIKSSMTVYCHACHARFSIIDLLGMDLGLGVNLKGKDFITVLKYGCEKYGVKFPEEKYSKSDNNPKSYLERCYDNRDKTDYFKKRGISKSTVKKFKLGYDPNFKIGNNKTIKAAIIPTSNDSYTARNTEESEIRYRRSPGPTHIFNIQALSKNLPVIITEGEFDALSIIDAGFNAIALSGVENNQKLIEACLETNFQSTLLIALDNDQCGQKNAIKLKNALDKYHIKNKILQPYGQYKDANQMYLNDSTKLTINLAKEVRETIKNEKAEACFERGKKIYMSLPREKQKEIDSYIKKYEKSKNNEN